MRWLLRILFLLVFVAGVLLAFAYPRVTEALGGREIASWRVFSPESGFERFETAVPEAPVWVYVAMTVSGRFQPSKETAVLTLTAVSDGRTVITAPLTFTQLAPHQDSPQAPEAIYRELAGVIEQASAAPYTFTVDRGDAEGIDIRSIEVELEAGGVGFDPRIPPLGYVLAALGFIALVLSFRRRTENPNSSPPPPKWGR